MVQVTLRLMGPGVDDFDDTLQSDLITPLAESMTTVGKSAIRIVLVADQHTPSATAAGCCSCPCRAPGLAASCLSCRLATDVTPAGHSGPLSGVKDVTLEINAGSAAACRLWSKICGR